MENSDADSKCIVCGFEKFVLVEEPVRTSLLPGAYEAQMDEWATAAAEPPFVETVGADDAPQASTANYAANSQAPEYSSDGRPEVLITSHPRMRTSADRSARKWFMLGQWTKKHWQFLLTVFLALVLSSVVYESCKTSGWIYPQAGVVWIEGLHPEMPEGGTLKLTAILSSKGNAPDKYVWSPPEMIRDNGQQSVTLDTTTRDRRTESYDIVISVIPKDKYGNDCPTVDPRTIRVVPKRQWNHAPEWSEQGRPHAEGKQVVQAGVQQKLHAAATDKDGDTLTYKWSVGNRDVQIIENGKPDVILQIPSNVTSAPFILLNVQLTVSDGFENGNILDELTLTVTPKPRPKGRGGKGTTRQELIITVQQPPGATPPAKSDATPAPVPPQKQEAAPATATPKPKEKSTDGPRTAEPSP
jgi:hypothetical protein